LPDFMFFLFIIDGTGVFDVIVNKFTFDNNLKHICLLKTIMGFQDFQKLSPYNLRSFWILKTVVEKLLLHLREISDNSKLSVVLHSIQFFFLVSWYPRSYSKKITRGKVFMRHA
jgi:hypothetical protein